MSPTGHELLRRAAFALATFGVLVLAGPALLVVAIGGTLAIAAGAEQLLARLS